MNFDDLQSVVGVYVLLGKDGKYLYKGSARDLRKRVAAHMQGRVARTRNRRPLTLIHVEYFADYTGARKRENWLKSGQGRKWLKEKIRLGGGMADASDLKSDGPKGRMGSTPIPGTFIDL